MDTIIGKVIELKNFIACQKNSVVSKEIIKSARGNVTVFSFDEGEGLSEHTSPYNAMVYVIDGKVEIKMSGKPCNLKEGEMIIMPKGKPHSLKALEKFKMMLVMIK